MTTEEQIPDDANDLRGHHFKRLMRKTLTLVLAATFSLGAAIAAGIAAGPVFAPIALVAVLGLVILIVFGIADSKAEQSFFEVYAQQRNMTLGGKQRLTPATPLLEKGDDRYAERTLTGQLADDCPGTLALFTYEEESRDSDGNKETNYYRYTLTTSEIPECAQFVPKLRCHRKVGFRALQGLEDTFRKDERVELESEALAKRYEIFADRAVDAVWLRRLFSPSFIVWLTEQAPEKFAFETVGGTLVCFVNGHKDSAAELDAMRTAGAAVTHRLREEASQTTPSA